MENDYPSLKKDLVKWTLRGVMYKAYVAVVLMLSAGRWDWWAGWLYVLIFLMFDLATALEVIPKDPALLVERSKSHPDAKSWDKVIMPLDPPRVYYGKRMKWPLKLFFRWYARMAPGRKGDWSDLDSVQPE